MKLFLTLAIVFSFLTIATAGCRGDFENDPEPWGGASCTTDRDCTPGSGGYCDLDSGNSTGVCVCPEDRAKADCSYRRESPEAPGGLNIGLPFVGIGGVGNFMIGRTGPGAGQLVLMLGAIFVSIVGCCLVCCEIGQIVYIALLIFSILGILAGFIWSIVDGALMLQCRYPDANGFAMFY